MSTTQSQRIRELKARVEELLDKISVLEREARARERETPLQWLATELTINPVDLQSMLDERGLVLLEGPK